jgi:uncharacterized protein YneF (UPF0154 family)
MITIEVIMMITIIAGFIIGVYIIDKIIEKWN